MGCTKSSRFVAGCVQNSRMLKLHRMLGQFPFFPAYSLFVSSFVCHHRSSSGHVWSLSGNRLMSSGHHLVLVWSSSSGCLVVVIVWSSSNDCLVVLWSSFGCCPVIVCSNLVHRRVIVYSSSGVILSSSGGRLVVRWKSIEIQNILAHPHSPRPGQVRQLRFRWPPTSAYIPTTLFTYTTAAVACAGVSPHCKNFILLAYMPYIWLTLQFSVFKKETTARDLVALSRQAPQLWSLKLVIFFGECVNVSN